MTDLRIGQGIDIHQIVAGRPLVLGGVTIPWDRGLEGHSDADVLIHAVCDAILGATGRGDIGTRFPNTDERWRGADSRVLLGDVWSEVHGEGWRLVNLDASILAEAPKLAPYIPVMKGVLAALLGVAVDQIGIKATTTERLGFPGRGEGMVAQAVVLLER